MKTKKIREERSVNMGKHDKQTTFSWQPMPDEWYKARIETLEKENQKLAEENKKLTEEIKNANRHFDCIVKRLEVTEDNAITEVVSLEKMLLNAAKQVWGEE